MQLGTCFAATLALAVCGLAAPAPAAPFTVLFEGVDGFGIDVDDALDAVADFAIPVVTPSFVGEADPVLAVLSQDLDVGSIDPFPPLGPGPHTATSEWEVQNQSGFDLLGDTYLVFVTTEPLLFGGSIVDYGDANVGLRIDPDDGWVFVKVSVPTLASPGATAGGAAALQDYYYPSLLLGSLSPGEIAAKFDVHYLVGEELDQVGTSYVLPQFQLGMGFTPIPEPGTAALLGLGLAGLAGLARRCP